VSPRDVVMPRDVPPRNVQLRDMPPRDIAPRDVVMPRDVPLRDVPPPPRVIEADRGPYPPAPRSPRYREAPEIADLPPAPRPARYREAPEIADLPPAPTPRAYRPPTRNALAMKPADRRRVLTDLSSPPATVAARPPVVAADAPTGPAKAVDEN